MSPGTLIGTGGWSATHRPRPCDQLLIVTGAAATTAGRNRAGRGCFVVFLFCPGRARLGSRCSAGRSSSRLPTVVVWLSSGVRSCRAPLAGCGSRGVCSARSSVARPRRSGRRSGEGGRAVDAGDHRDRSAQAVGDDRGARSSGRCCWRPAGSRWTRPATGSCWAMCGSGRPGSGRSKAPTASAGRWPARLLADGETVVDVPAKLAARVRVFDTGHGRKTDATDAHADRDGGAAHPRAAAAGRRRGPGRAAAAGRPPRRTVPDPDADAQPAAPAAGRAGPRRRTAAPVRCYRPRRCSPVSDPGTWPDGPAGRWPPSWSARSRLSTASSRRSRGGWPRRSPPPAPG